MEYRAKILQYFTRRDRAWILSLLVASAIVYLPFLGNPFKFDDLNFFATDLVGAYSNQWRQFGLRWLSFSSLGRINEVFSAEFPHIYHAYNWLLHAANTLSLFYLLRFLIAAVHAEGKDSSTHVRGAWIGAMVFSLHPVAAFAVGYAIQASVLMATLFSLLTQLAYLRGIVSGKKRWFALAACGYFLACFSKEHSVLLPLVLGAMSLLFRDRIRIQWQAILLAWVAFFAIALPVVLNAVHLIGSAVEVEASTQFAQLSIVASTPMLHLLSVLTQAGLFFKYLLLWILPVPGMMSLDMRESFIASPLAWQAWLGGAAFVLYGVTGARLLLKGGAKGLAGFAMLYPWLLFGVEMAGIRVQEIFVLYRSYLWMPGFMLLIPLLTQNWSKRRTVLVLVGTMALLVSLSWHRLWVFADDYRIWNEAANMLENDHAAGADRILYNRGRSQYEKGNWAEAAADLRRVVEISPQLEPVRYLLGASYTNLGQYEEALVQYDAAIAIRSDDARVYYAKGFTLKKLRRDAEAMLQIQHACRLKDQMACLIVAMDKPK